MQNCDNSVICALVEIIHNLLSGNITLTANQKKKLQKYKKQFRYLSSKCINKNKKKKNINKKISRRVIVQSGGALPFLIPLLAPLIAKAALSGAVATGVGLATKKILGQ